MERSTYERLLATRKDPFTGKEFEEGDEALTGRIYRSINGPRERAGRQPQKQEIKDNGDSPIRSLSKP